MAGMPQESLLDLVLDLLYTCDLPQLENNKIATFANDTTISKIGKNYIKFTEKLQTTIYLIQKWTKKLKINSNQICTCRFYK